MDPKISRLMAAFIDQKLSGCENPRDVPDGKALANVDQGWRWRVGSYRILATIDDGTIIINAFRNGHRREACREP